jgi:LPS O-antigen subunit length determinant protein (WzzB/FepE family)
MKENQEYPLYEDEIDLRALLETLWRRRKLIFESTAKTHHGEHRAHRARKVYE